MFHLVSWIFDILCNPVPWVIGLTLAGGFTARRPWGRRATLSAGFALLVLSLEPVSNALLFRLERQVPSSVRTGVSYDALILLGGAVEHGPTQTLGVPFFDDDVERVLTAFDLLREGKARDVIVTGGRVGVGDRVVEADVTAKQLERWGIPSERIARAGTSRNTLEDAVVTRRVATERGYRTLLLVTSARHMPRALDRFNNVHLSVDTLPVDFRSSGEGVPSSYIPRAEYLVDSADVIREVVGRWLYRVADVVSG